MTRPQVMEEICTPSFIGRRQRHKSFLAKTAMEFQPASDCEEAGIALVQDDRFHYLMVMKKKDGTPFLQFYKTENGCRTLVKETEIKDSKRLYLSVQGNTTDYDFLLWIQRIRTASFPVRRGCLSFKLCCKQRLYRRLPGHVYQFQPPAQHRSR